MFYCFGFSCLKIGLVKITKKQITCGVYSLDVNQILANQRLKRLLKEQRLFEHCLSCTLTLRF